MNRFGQDDILQPGDTVTAQPGSPDTGRSVNQGFMDNPLHTVRQQIENQIGQAVDHYAGHVPGGDRYAPEAKKAIASALDGLQRQLENEAASRMGGLGGAAFGNNNNSRSNGSL